MGESGICEGLEVLLCVWLLGITLDGDSDNDGPDKLDMLQEGMNEKEWSLANTGAGSFAVSGSSYVSSVSGPLQHPVTFEVSHGGILVKGPLALMVERLKDWEFIMLAAFAELLFATLPFLMRCLPRRLPLVFGTAAGALPLPRLGSARQLSFPGGWWPVARPRLPSAVPREACRTDGRDDGSFDVLFSSAGFEEAGCDYRKIGVCLFHWITLETSGR